MPGMTLCGEAMSFAHDADLIGYCLDNPDEPAGDDFETRCRQKNMGCFIPIDQIAEEETVRDDDLDQDFDEPSGEVRGAYARFCAMNERDQAMYMYKLTMYICALVGVSVTVWEPSDEFVLTAIELELSDEELLARAYAEYLATPMPDENNPSDEDEELIGREADDTIRVSQQSTRGSKTLKTNRDLRNPGHRSRQSRTMVPKKNVEKFPTRFSGGRASRSHDKSESHSTKYGRQDYRHQLPRIEAKLDRRFAANQVMWADEEERFSRLEAQMVEIDHRKRFERDVAGLDWDSRLAFSHDALNEALNDMQKQMHGDPKDVAGPPCPEDSRRRLAVHVEGTHHSASLAVIVDGYTLTRREVQSDIARDLHRIDTHSPSFCSGKHGSCCYRNEPRKSARDLAKLSL